MGREVRSPWKLVSSIQLIVPRKSKHAQLNRTFFSFSDSMAHCVISGLTHANKRYSCSQLSTQNKDTSVSREASLLQCKPRRGSRSSQVEMLKEPGSPCILSLFPPQILFYMHLCAGVLTSTAGSPERQHTKGRPAK